MATQAAHKFTPDMAKAEGGDSQATQSFLKDRTQTPTASRAPESTLARAEAELASQKRVLGAWKAIFPVMRSIVINPGTASSAEARSKVLSAMIDKAERSSAVFIEGVAPELGNTGWARHQAFQVAAELMAAEWEKCASVEQASQLAEDLGFFQRLKEHVAPAGPSAFDWLEKSGNVTPVKNEDDAVTRVRFSVAKSFAPFYADIIEFPFWKDRISQDAVEKLASRFVNDVSELAAKYANELADQNNIDPQNRMTLWQGTIVRAFGIAREEYRTLVREAQQALAKAETPDQRKAVRIQWAKEFNVDDVVMTRTRASLSVFHGIVEKYLEGGFAQHEAILKQVNPSQKVR